MVRYRSRGGLILSPILSQNMNMKTLYQQQLSETEDVASRIV